MGRHEDRIHQLEKDHDSLQREVRMLTNTIKSLEERIDFDDMRVLHACNHLEETHSLVQHQQIKIESLDQRVRDEGFRWLVLEIGAATLYAMIGYLQQQLAQIWI